MTEQEKDLLLKDLCARLPYGVLCHVDGFDEPHKLNTIEVDYENGHLLDFGYDENSGLNIQAYLSEVKPYLRPLWALKEAQKSKLLEFNFRFDDSYDEAGIVNEDPNEYDDYNQHPYTFIHEDHCSGLIDFFNSEHIDYRGLVKKDLALAATENMYK